MQEAGHRLDVGSDVQGSAPRRRRARGAWSIARHGRPPARRTVTSPKPTPCPHPGMTGKRNESVQRSAARAGPQLRAPLSDVGPHHRVGHVHRTVLVDQTVEDPLRWHRRPLTMQSTQMLPTQAPRWCQNPPTSLLSGIGRCRRWPTGGVRNRLQNHVGGVLGELGGVSLCVTGIPCLSHPVEARVRPSRHNSWSWFPR